MGGYKGSLPVLLPLSPLLQLTVLLLPLRSSSFSERARSSRPSATLSNPNVGEEAKQHAQDVLDGSSLCFRRSPSASTDLALSILRFSPCRQGRAQLQVVVVRRLLRGVGRRCALQPRPRRPQGCDPQRLGSRGEQGALAPGPQGRRRRDRRVKSRLPCARRFGLALLPHCSSSIVSIRLMYCSDLSSATYQWPAA